MKQILNILSSGALLMLAGCAASPAHIGENIAGIGSGGTPTSLSPSSSQQGPGATGSIVPLPEEGAVVDLPDSSVHMQASSTYPSRNTAESDAEDLSEDERHRRELINRGDLQEGEPLPVQ